MISQSGQTTHCRLDVMRCPYPMQACRTSADWRAEPRVLPVVP
jgi:hypothetical protein